LWLRSQRRVEWKFEKKTEKTWRKIKNRQKKLLKTERVLRRKFVENEFSAGKLESSTKQ
jgi:hypothetical protein